MTGRLPAGVAILDLVPNRDRRGIFTELYRESWGVPDRFPQWNLVLSNAGVLRGVHIHRRHADYLLVAQGRVTFNLKDLRSGSPTEGLTCAIEMKGAPSQVLYIPMGIAHGFYFHEQSIHVYAVSDYWNMADELGCRFDDPELGMNWPDYSPILSERDENLPPLTEIIDLIPSYSQPAGQPL